MYHNTQDTSHTKIDTTTQLNDLETPSKAPHSPPSKAFVHMLDNSRSSGLYPPFFSNTNPATLQAHECSQSALLASLQRHSQLLLASLPDVILSLLPDPALQPVRAFQQPPGCTPTACPPAGTSPPHTLKYRHYYPLLESEILHLAHHIGSLHSFLPTIDITSVTSNVRALQIGVSEAIHNSEDVELIPVEKRFCLFCTCCAVPSCPHDTLALKLTILTVSSTVCDFSGRPALDDKPSSKALCCAFCFLGMLK